MLIKLFNILQQLDLNHIFTVSIVKLEVVSMIILQKIDIF